MGNLQQAVDVLQRGGVIAYPTEGVFGLGCDPDNQAAMLRLLAIKQRPIEKGVILIAANYEQLRPYIDEDQLTEQQLLQVLASWPAPLTWVMPASVDTPNWVRGQFDTVAVRVSNHPLVQQFVFGVW